MKSVNKDCINNKKFYISYPKKFKQTACHCNKIKIKDKLHLIDKEKNCIFTNNQCEAYIKNSKKKILIDKKCCNKWWLMRDEKQKYKCIKKCGRYNCNCRKLIINTSKGKKHISLNCNKSCVLKYNNKGQLFCKGYTSSGKPVYLPSSNCKMKSYIKKCGGKNISTDCLQQLWRIFGCSTFGSGYPNISTYLTTNAGKELENIKEFIKKIKRKADLGDKQSIKICYNRNHSRLNLDKCKKNSTYSANSIYKPQCLQYLWKKYGCTPGGMQYPMSSNSDYGGCNPKIKKCNIFDTLNRKGKEQDHNTEDVCWEKCNKSEIDQQLFKLSLAAENKIKSAVIRCKGYQGLMEGMQVSLKQTNKRNIFITIIIIILFLTYYLVYYN